MNPTIIQSTGLGAGILLTVCSMCAYAAEAPVPAPINKDQVNGRVEEAKGSVKEITGKAIDDKGMQIEGNVQKNLGKAQAGYGDLKKDIKDGNK